MTQTMTDFLTSVFKTQREDLQVDIEPVAFWREIISGRTPLDARARSLLMASPLNRRLYDEAYQAERDALISRVANLAHAPRLRQAASGTGRQLIQVDGLQGIALEIRPLGDGWQITLDVSHLQLPLGARVELHDDLGRVWISGDVPTDGMLDGFWQLEVAPPQTLAEGRAIGLRLDGLEMIAMTKVDGGTSDG